MLPGPDLLLELLVFGLLIPGGVTAAGLALALRRGRAGAAAPLAVAVGLAVGLGGLAYVGAGGWEFLQPVDAWHFLPALALVATAVGFVERRRSLPIALRVLGRLAVAGLAAWLLLRDEAQPPAGWYPALAISIIAIWGPLMMLADRWPGPALPILLALTAFALAALLELSGILRFALTASALGAVLCGCSLVAFRVPRPNVTACAVPAFAVLVPGLLVVGRLNTFSNVPAESYLLLLAAPVALGLTGALPAESLRPATRAALRLGVTLVPLAAAVATALTAAFQGE